MSVQKSTKKVETISNSIQKLQTQIEQYEQNEIGFKEKIEALKLQLVQMENERKDYVKKYNEATEECKEANMKLIEIKEELQELKRKNINPARYMEWTSDEFVDWICHLERQKFKRYEQTLREAFKSEGIDGSSIQDIEKNDWKGWGLNSFNDRTTIHKHLQKLKHQHQNNDDNENEVAPAYNINYNEGGDKTEYH